MNKTSTLSKLAVFKFKSLGYTANALYTLKVYFYVLSDYH